MKGRRFALCQSLVLIVLLLGCFSIPIFPAAAEERFPRLTPERGIELAQQYYDRACAEENLRLKFADLTSAHALDPGNERYKDELAKVDEAIKTNGDGYAAAERGKVLYERAAAAGTIDQKIELLERAHEAAPHDYGYARELDGAKERKARTYVNRAYHNIRHQQSQAAIDSLQQALKIHEDPGVRAILDSLRSSKERPMLEEQIRDRVPMDSTAVRSN